MEGVKVDWPKDRVIRQMIRLVEAAKPDGVVLCFCFKQYIDFHSKFNPWDLIGDDCIGYFRTWFLGVEFMTFYEEYDDYVYAMKAAGWLS